MCVLRGMDAKRPTRNRALFGHWALRIGLWALRIGHCALSIGHSYFSPSIALSASSNVVAPNFALPGSSDLVAYTSMPTRPNVTDSVLLSWSNRTVTESTAL